MDLPYEWVHVYFVQQDPIYKLRVSTRILFAPPSSRFGPHVACANLYVVSPSFFMKQFNAVLQGVKRGALGTLAPTCLHFKSRHAPSLAEFMARAGGASGSKTVPAN